MRAVDIIAKKRDGLELDAGEIGFFVQGLTSGQIPDYQVAAWAMAVLLRGMTARETTDLTLAMVRSGETLDLTPVAPWVVDKHSTGGVGDKTSLVVAPIIAALGLPVAKMSGRGLGFSGGTLDKLESIPGFQVSLSMERFLSNLRQYGIVLAGQTADLAPADGKLYALRDVTATVPSLPLIASSIMSKKIAAGAQAIVLDVKVGRGAFMETLDQARALAQMMVRIGEGVGRLVTAVLSDMSQPLGRAVGNALEVVEAVETLRGGGPRDFVEHCLAIAGEMLILGKRAAKPGEAHQLAAGALRDGSAMAKFRVWVGAQGGDVAAIDGLSRLPQAPVILPVLALREGHVARIDARVFGLTAVELGAGRAHKGDPVDHAVGIVLGAKVGEKVDAGDVLFTVHAQNAAVAATARDRLLAAYDWSDTPVDAPPLIHEVLRPSST
jgi:pyrimidine-nucleoside phosphorylase